MTTHATFKIRCRAIILHEGKLLIVKHRPESTYYALPGGHLEPGESVVECVRREMIEELGVEPAIGRLLYVHTFQDKDSVQAVEFFYEVTNGQNFVSLEGKERTHAHELAEVRWIEPTENLMILPTKVTQDFASGTLLLDQVRYTKG